MPGPACSCFLGVQCADCPDSVSEHQPASCSQGRSRGAARQDSQNPQGGVALLTLAVTPNHPLIVLVCTSRVSRVGVASAKRLSEHRFGRWSVGETEAQKGHKPGMNRGRGRGKPMGSGCVVSHCHPPSSLLMRTQSLRRECPPGRG